ncbi:MAG: heavy-metal-associated domain-containing protein [Candidatus Bathyarchaeota archaeon]|nr:heavy metal-associated domain-containing protein [Candidatus Bathyarchaeum tardum]WGM90487.1 MAG: heavy metal-associated domain-containing protein [Candidatus Bathyarchaeum tardum]WNZ29445.1 MAG: heavy-metal-associated domain-containing protein [Candidatus Bathyarchaeota archaeon]
MTIEKIELKTEKIDNAGCRSCGTDYAADNLKHALARLNGVSKVNVDKITGHVSITFDVQKITPQKFTERIEKLGYHVEVESREEIQ